MKKQLRRSETPEYIAWACVIRRCYKSTANRYDRYGGRGVKICDRWKVFENFLADMGKKPSALHTIDRINNDGDYDLENCRWATRKEQARNRQSNRIITFGRVSKSLAEWGESTGLGRSIIEQRLDKLGWSVERALTTPKLSFSECGKRGCEKRYGKTKS